MTQRLQAMGSQAVAYNNHPFDLYISNDYLYCILNICILTQEVQYNDNMLRM